MSPAPETKIGPSSDLVEGRSIKFGLSHEGRDLDCFAVRFGGVAYAYLNQCRHVAMTLDWVDNQFFTEDGAHLQCPTHGAWYLPDTGECIAGPPCGKFLHRVPIEERDGELFAQPPETT